MARLVWAILCQRVITDRETNTVSYIDATEEFHLPDFPGETGPFMVGTLWEREEPEEELDIRFRFLAPGKRKGGEFVPPATTLNRPRHRINVMVAGLRAKEPGRYTVLVEQKAGSRWKKAAMIPLLIKGLEE